MCQNRARYLTPTRSHCRKAFWWWAPTRPLGDSHGPRPTDSFVRRTHDGTGFVSPIPFAPSLVHHAEQFQQSVHLSDAWYRYGFTVLFKTVGYARGPNCCWWASSRGPLRLIDLPSLWGTRKNSNPQGNFFPSLRLWFLSESKPLHWELSVLLFLLGPPIDLS